MNRAEAQRYRKEIEKAARSLSDTDALEAPEMFPRWKAGIQVLAEERLYYDGDGKLYKVVQGHTTQEGWEPDKTPALFTEVAEPGTIPVWKQPTGAQDAYMMGDKVHYPDEEGPVYVSTVDNNVWQPGVYGWEEES